MGVAPAARANADVRMPPGFSDEGLRAAVGLRKTHPGLAVLVLSQYIEKTSAGELLDSGDGTRVGYLLKNRVGDVAEFNDALQRVAAGGTVVDPEVVRQLLRHRRDPLVSEPAVGKRIGHILTKLDLPPDADDHRRVLAVLSFLRA